MRAIIQRVKRATVQVDNQTIGEIERGYVAFIAIHETDTWNEAQRIADKIINLRLFEGPNGRFDQSIQDISGGLLIISQFTLYAETRKGRRPSWGKASAPEKAQPLLEQFTAYLKEQPIQVATGQFGADMDINLTNSGPVTIILDSDEWKNGRG